MTYLVSGRGIFESEDSGRVDLEAGHLIFILPGIWHRYRPSGGQHWHTYWTGFDGPVARSVIEHMEIDPAQPVRMIGYQEKIIETFLEMIEVSQIEFSGYQQVLAGEIMKLLGWVHAISRKAEFRDQDVDRIMKAAKLILMQLDPEQAVEEVAGALNMGYSKFRKLFRDYTQLSPGQFRMQHRLKKAMLMVAADNRPIKEIAYTLGFESPQYFSRIFRKKTGMSPGEFRRGRKYYK